MITLAKALLAAMPILVGCDASTMRREKAIASSPVDSSFVSRQRMLGEFPLSLQVSGKGLCGAWLTSDFPQRFRSTVLNHWEELNSSRCLHLVSAYGLEISVRSADGAEERLLDLLLDQERAIKVFGHPTLFESAFGVRPYARSEAGRGSQAHHDQLLGCLAQVGVGTGYHCKVNHRDHVVGDILADSLADFYIEKKELAFTAISYALLLPPNSSWKNKFGEEVSFSSVVGELLSRDIGTSHCCGTHLFESMIVIDRVDREHHSILNPASQRMLEERIEELVMASVNRQKSDGSWDSTWFRPKEVLGAEVDDDLSTKLLATGHILQILAKLPDRFAVDHSVIERGVRWLQLTTSQLGEHEMTSDFCPLSHVAWCLTHFGPQEDHARQALDEKVLDMRRD